MQVSTLCIANVLKTRFFIDKAKVESAMRLNWRYLARVDHRYHSRWGRISILPSCDGYRFSYQLACQNRAFILPAKNGAYPGIGIFALHVLCKGPARHPYGTGIFC